MIILSHNYPRPDGINESDYYMAYHKWCQAKEEKNYTYADQIRNWVEFKHGVTFSQVDDELIEGNPDHPELPSNAMRMTLADWTEKYFDYLVLKFPEIYTKDGLVKAYRDSDSRYPTRLLSYGF